MAIVAAYDDPNAESDLAAYRSSYGLPPCSSTTGCFQKVDQIGGTNYPPPDPMCDKDPTQCWAVETSIDVDMVSAACPNCSILLVEANTPDPTDLGTAVDTAVQLGARHRFS